MSQHGDGTKSDNANNNDNHMSMNAPIFESNDDDVKFLRPENLE
jgi:hypothetical protein